MKHRTPFIWAFGSVIAASILVFHARLFDFICDDAYIAFRYARNLSDHGSPVYNIGERVEGYTNFLWMLLSAICFKVGVGVTGTMFVLGGGAAVVLMLAMGLLWWASSYPKPIALLPMLAVAATAPVAAWTLSGLETTMYASMIALGGAFGVATATLGGRRLAFATGVIFALATLTRPEGIVAMGIGLMILLIARRGAAIPDILMWIAGFSLLFMPFFCWRWWYYGYPLPNTFYLKTSGNAAELRERGRRYLVLAGKDFGVVTAALIAGLFVPCSPQRDGEDILNFRARRVLSWTLRLNVLTIIPYVISVGGDFLGLYRFLVPSIPLAWLAFALACCHIVDRLPRHVWVSRAAIAIGLVGLVGYSIQQAELGEFARTQTNQDQQAAGVEPIHWTRLYARRWGAMGRWIAERARPGDWMAVGAAGAMPYFAGISNIDTLGLCDSEVAHNGIVIGSRPGHQRHARMEYTLSKQPVFLFEGDQDSNQPLGMRYDPNWDRRGYLWVEARVQADKHDAPSLFYHYFLMRKDRALELKESSDLKVATGFGY